MTPSKPGNKGSGRGRNLHFVNKDLRYTDRATWMRWSDRNPQIGTGIEIMKGEVCQQTARYHFQMPLGHR